MLPLLHIKDYECRRVVLPRRNLTAALSTPLQATTRISPRSLILLNTASCSPKTFWKLKPHQSRFRIRYKDEKAILPNTVSMSGLATLHPGLFTAMITPAFLKARGFRCIDHYNQGRFGTVCCAAVRPSTGAQSLLLSAFRQRSVTDKISFSPGVLRITAFIIPRH